MHNGKKKYKYSLGNKITLCFSMMLVFLIVIFVFFYYMRMVDNRNREAVVSLKDSLNSQEEMFFIFLESYDQMSLNFRSDEKFMNILQGKEVSAGNNLYLQKQLKNFFMVQKNIDDIYLYLTKSEQMIKMDLTASRFITEENVQWNRNPFYNTYENYAAYKKYRTVFPDCSYDGMLKKSFYYVRVLVDVENNEPLAFIQIHFDGDFYEKLIGQKEKSDTELIGIFTENNQPILISNNQYWNEQKEYVLKLLNRDFDDQNDVYSDSRNYAVVHAGEGFKHIVISSKMELQKSYNEILRQSVLLFLIITVILLIVIKKISDGIMKPVVQLAEQVKRIDIENPSIHVDRIQDDEIGYLTVQFEYMLKKMDDLIEEKYISTINENNARMKALQAQINPHFLYNTLQVISTQAMINKDRKIVEMVNALANTYRYSVKIGDIVTVKQEKENLENYLNINKYRYEEQLTYSIRIDETLDDFVVPKFTFQILAENAIKHGMNENVLRLEFEVKKEQQRVIFRLVDNGDGFDEKERLKLMERIRYGRGQYSENRGLGLQNLYDRFVNLYGEENITLNIETESERTLVEVSVVV